MDVEPIYCAEQIHIPPDLADVLKAFTKEVRACCAHSSATCLHTRIWLADEEGTFEVCFGRLPTFMVAPQNQL